MLLSMVIYKNAVDNRRAAWRVITSIEQNEKPEGKEQLASHAREYIAEVEGELQKIRDGILALMDKNLIPLVSTDESKVLYYKMKSDYYRYLAECATYDAKGKATEDTCAAYAKATKIAEKDLVVNHPVRLAMDTKRSLKTRCSETNEEFDRRVVDDRQTELKAVIDAICTPNSDTSFDTYDKTVSTDFLQMPMETPQLPCINKVVDVTVATQQVVQIPQVHVVEKTVEIPQLDVIEKIIETSKTFSQNRAQQRFGKQTIEPPAISLTDEVVEAPDTQTQDKTQHVVNTHVQHVVNTVEVERPKLAKETVQETINQVTKHIRIPQVQFLNKVDDMLVDVQQQIRPMTQTVQIRWSMSLSWCKDRFPQTQSDTRTRSMPGTSRTRIGPFETHTRQLRYRGCSTLTRWQTSPWTCKDKCPPLRLHRTSKKLKMSPRSLSPGQ